MPIIQPVERPMVRPSRHDFASQDLQLRPGDADESAPLLVAIARQLGALRTDNDASLLADARQLLADAYDSIEPTREFEAAAA